MTDTLDPDQVTPVRTDPPLADFGLGATTARCAPGTPDASDDVASSTDTLPDPQAVEVRTALQECDGDLFLEALAAMDIHGLTVGDLRVLADQAYQLMDLDFPPDGAVEGYERISDELDGRDRQAPRRVPVDPPRETFRDNSLRDRFELLIDGGLAVYMKYTRKGAQVVLTDGVEQPGFRDEGLDAVLMRQITLSAHERGLSLVPQCPMAFSFLADHPQDLVDTSSPEH